MTTTRSDPQPAAVVAAATTAARPLSRTFHWRFAAPPAVVWQALADTARFNEAARLPPHRIEERPRADGSVEFTGIARLGPLRMRWTEVPVNWVAGRWFVHCRRFAHGPLASLCATLTLHPDNGGSTAEYRIDATPRNLLGRLALAAGLPRIRRTFSALAEDAGRWAAGRSAQPFRSRAPRPGAETAARVEDLVMRIEASGHGHGLSRRLADHLLTAQEVDLLHIRPLALARQWQCGEREAIELCLEAARTGLLELRWELLCPRCRVAKAGVLGLDELPEGAHCGTCNIDYGRDFSRNVEACFRPASWIRPLGTDEYCMFGPMSTPHIVVHVTVEGGGRRTLDYRAAPGGYRLRTLEAGPELDIDSADGRLPEVIVDTGRMRAGEPQPHGRVVLRNDTTRPRTVVIEERAWVRDALTADRVTALQAFRDLFSDQVLRPGDEVAVRHVALLFTDLKASTALYDRIGDAAAYGLVREHFAFLAAIVRRCEGAVVKTIGDAVMATFVDSRRAFEAALAIQREIGARDWGRAGQPIVIKLGLHAGPCIAVNLNGRIDYFGSTVNLAARLQGESRGGDIVVSAPLAAELALDDGSAPGILTREQARLRGFAEPVAFVRVLPSPETAPAADHAP